MRVCQYHLSDQGWSPIPLRLASLVFLVGRIVRGKPVSTFPENALKSRVPHDESTGAEAPRPARDRINGRSPGWRVAACHRLPGSSSPSGPVAQARRLQLRGQLRNWNLGSAPHSLFALTRETVDRIS